MFKPEFGDSIVYLAEEKCVSRYALSCGAPVMEAQKLRDRIRLSPPSAHFEQSPHYGSHHVAQKSVRRYVESPMRLVVGDPSGFENGTYRGLVVRPYFFEA